MNATMIPEKTKHFPVMLKQVLSIISPQHGGTFIDCTFGGGGYSKAILDFPGTKVLAIDRDKLTQDFAEQIKKKFPNRFSFFKEKFSNLSKIIDKKIKPKAIIFDLGMSSYQLSDKNRGFSFESENQLNMEMGINEYSAYDVINNLDKNYLASIIKILGDEKDGKKIANRIEKYRKIKPIKTSSELTKIIKEVKKKYTKNKKNPATKTFQAIRIFVNKEVTELIKGLTEATKLLSDGGVLIVVSFHSLEDKIVKNFFSIYSNLKKNPSRYLPLSENNLRLYKLLSKKPLIPERNEVDKNIRSRSAKLRYAIRNNKTFSNLSEFHRKFNYFLKLEENKA